jgi:hypothetical protein
VKAKVLGLQMPTVFLFAFIRSVDDKNAEDLGLDTETDEMYLALDAKLFASLVECVTGNKKIRYSKMLESEVVLGKGRQGLKKLDQGHMYELDVLVARASTRLSRSKCLSGGELENFIRSWKYDTNILFIAGQKMPEKVEITLLESALERLDAAKMTMAAFKAKPIMEQRLVDLINALQKEGAHVSEMAGAPTGNATVFTKEHKHCDFCSKEGHMEAQCWLKFPDQRPKKGDKGKGKKGKGKSKGKGKGGKGKGGKGDGGGGYAATTGAYPWKPSTVANPWNPCQHCGRKHDPQTCWFGPHYRQQQNTQQQGQNQQQQKTNGGAGPAAATMARAAVGTGAGGGDAAQAFLAFLTERRNVMSGSGAVALQTACPAGSSSSSSDATYQPWVLDSGASQHLCNADNMASVYYTEPASARLSTCLGTAEIAGGAVVDIPTASFAEHAYMLPNTPNCASMGRLIEDRGFRIQWERGNCQWITPEGSTFQLPVRDYNPILEYASANGNAAAAVSGALEHLSGMTDQEAVQALEEFQVLWARYEAEQAATEIQRESERMISTVGAAIEKEDDDDEPSF